MKVRMIVTTNSRIGLLREGQIVDVPDDTAIRWIKGRIADDVPQAPENPVKAVTNDQIKPKPGRKPRSR